MPLSFGEVGLFRDFLNTFARMTLNTKDKLKSMSTRPHVSSDIVEVLDAEAARLDESIHAARRLAEYYGATLGEDGESLERHMDDARILCDHIRAMRRAQELTQQISARNFADQEPYPSTPPPSYHTVTVNEVRQGSDRVSVDTTTISTDVNDEIRSKIRQILEQRGVDERTIIAYLNTAPRLETIVESINSQSISQRRSHTTLRRGGTTHMVDPNRVADRRRQRMAMENVNDVDSLGRTRTVRFEINTGLRSPVRPSRRVATE